MPIYEYKCLSCDNLFELLRKKNDRSNPSCLECFSGNVKKVLSMGSFQLKGSGWASDCYDKKPMVDKSDSK